MGAADPLKPEETIEEKVKEETSDDDTGAAATKAKKKKRKLDVKNLRPGQRGYKDRAIMRYVKFLLNPHLAFPRSRLIIHLKGFFSWKRVTL